MYIRQPLKQLADAILFEGGQPSSTTCSRALSLTARILYAHAERLHAGNCVLKQ